MKKFRSRKGVGVNALMGIIAGAIVGLMAIGISTGFVSDIAGGQAEAQHDTEQIQEIVEIAESKCNAAVECVETDATTETLEIRSAQSLEITGQPPEQTLVLQFPDDTRKWDLEYCDYKMSSTDLTQTQSWNFRISAEFGNPPTVRIGTGTG